MRRFVLGIAVAAAVLTAVPASARTFRVDGFDCTSSEPFFFCWGENLSVSSAMVALPTDNLPLPFTPNAPGYPSPPGASVNPGVFEHNGFTFTAFDYAAFLASPEFAAAVPDPSVIDAPTVLVTRGFARVTSTQGNPFESTDAPLLRINWYFDPDLFALFPDIFAEPISTSNFGVQMIFYGDGSQSIAGVPGGVGFELNGLNDDSPTAYRYSSSSTGWSGTDQPCNAFANNGSCIGAASVPEPSSVALLGLGLIALVGGFRIGGKARTQLA